MVESVETALQQHHHHQRCNTKRPARHLIKRRSSGRVPVTSGGGNKRAVVITPLTAATTTTKPYRATATTTEESSNSGNTKAEPVGAVTNNKLLPTSSPPPSSVASAATAQPPGLSRTQQKLLLQRQQCLVEDKTTMVHPSNMRRLTHELDRVGREYRSVKQFQDPMQQSLARCILQKDQQPRSDAAAAVHRRHQGVKAQLLQHKSMQYGRDGEERKRSIQGPSFISSTAGDTADASPSTRTNRPSIRWSAGAFLDRVLWN